MNLACVGARPLGLVNCLNFGNPEHPEVMWQLSESIDGMAEACRAFGIPVVGGNVSLYNESGGRDIDPTPVVGLVGLVDRPRPPAARVRAGRGRHPRRARSRDARRSPGLAGLGSVGHRDGAGARPRPRRASRGGRPRAAARRSRASSPACTTPPTASGWRWPRWRCAAGSGFDGASRPEPTTRGCSPSRRAGWSRAWRPAQEAGIVETARSAGVPATRPGRGRRRPPRGGRPRRRVRRRGHRRPGAAGSRPRSAAGTTH